MIYLPFLSAILMLLAALPPAQVHTRAGKPLFPRILFTSSRVDSATAGLFQRREPSLAEPREETAAAGLDGRLYVIAGFDRSGADTWTVFVFDGRRWTTGPSFPLPLDHPSAAVLANRLYVAGGFSNGRASDRVFVLSADRSSWSTAPHLHHARGALALVSVGSVLEALGGKESSGIEVSQVESYRPGGRSWRDVATLPAPRDHLAGFTYRGWACAAGGRSPNTARVDCYDPTERRWRRLPDLPVPTSGAGAAALGQEVIVAGGEGVGGGDGSQIISQLARFDGSRWHLGRMLLPRHGIQLAVFQKRVWACGGGSAPGLHPVASCTSIR